MSDNPPAAHSLNPFAAVAALLAQATAAAAQEGLLAAAVAAADIAVDRPREAGHGDLATNLCFALGKANKTNPRALAEKFCEIVRRCDGGRLLAKLEVAGPGFVNLTLQPAAWQSAVAEVLQAGPAFGRTRAAAPQRVLLEFVSANPTGPLHVGHGRGAVLGDALASVLRAAGHSVATEYYINNVGNQIAKLGQSVWHWLREPAARQAALATWAAGEAVAFPQGFPSGFPEDGYRGDYVAQTADVMAADPDLQACAAISAWDDDAAWATAANPTGRADNRLVSVRAWQRQIGVIASVLKRLGVSFDKWQSERELHGLDGGPDRVAACAQRLLAAGWAYHDNSAGGDDDGPSPQGNALFFRGTREDVPKAFRDAKDRVILRSDGRPTYFAADIAYHDDKLGRGFDHLINVLGADHHGYVPRLKGVLHAIGDMRRTEGDPNAAQWSGDRLEVPLVQLVSLLRDGQPVAMGKRSGDFVTLSDVMDEVTTAGNPQSGTDAVRFTFLLRKADAAIDFDLELARRASLDNPVYYVQYGHARLASVLARAAAEGKPLRPDEARQGAHAAALQLPEERDLCLLAASFPAVIARAAALREPHHVAYFLNDLVAAFHGYYAKHKHTGRVIGDDDPTTQARLALVAAVQQVVANGLTLLGIAAPDRMAALPAAEPAPSPESQPSPDPSPVRQGA